jgi:hypothetical protein
MQVLHAFYHKNSTFESKLSTVAVDTNIVRYIIFFGLFPSGTDREVNINLNAGGHSMNVRNRRARARRNDR